MAAPVCPYPREDGYWLVENGLPRFVPFVPVMAPGAVIVPFPFDAQQAARFFAEAAAIVGAKVLPLREPRP